LFLGYSKNLGITETDLVTQNATGPYFSRGKDVAGKGYANDDIGYMYRISPRFIYNAGKFRIAPEIEYTVAGYGNADGLGLVEDAEAVGNFRFLVGVYYFF